MRWCLIWAQRSCILLASARLRKLKENGLPLVKSTSTRPVRLGCPVAGVGKLVAIGLNYSDHAAEAGMPLPQEPIVSQSHDLHSGPNDPKSCCRVAPKPTGKSAGRSHWHLCTLCGAENALHHGWLLRGQR